MLVGFVRKEYDSSSSSSLERSNSPLCSPPATFLVQLQFFQGLSSRSVRPPSGGSYPISFLEESKEAQSHHLQPLWSAFSFWVPRGPSPWHDGVLIYTYCWVSKHCWAPAKTSSFSDSVMKAVDAENRRKCVPCASLNYRWRRSLFLSILWNQNIHWMRMSNVKCNSFRFSAPEKTRQQGSDSIGNNDGGSLQKWESWTIWS